jgi:hypothetical protein
MPAKRPLLTVTAAIGFAMFALLADPMMRRASAQLGPAENANIQAQELAEEGARLLIVARAALAALPDNPLVVRGAMRGMRQWARAYGEFRRSNDYDYDPKAGKTQVRLSKKLRMLFQQMGKLYIALRPPEPEAKPQPAVPRDPFPDLEPRELPWTDPRLPDPNRDGREKAGLDNPGGYVICHGAVPGALGIQRDPSLQVRQSMLKECPHLVGGAGRN